jgi:hypothetical protein
MSDAGFQPRAVNLTDRARLYLSCVDDWKAPFEIAKLLGDSPPPSYNDIKRMMGRLAARGLVDYSARNDAYRISEEARAAVGGA